MSRALISAALVFSSLTGCRMEPGVAQAPRRSPASVAVAPPPAPVVAPAPVTAAPPPPSVVPAAARKPAGPHVEWTDTISWQPLEAGLAQARTSQKPVVLVLYADWCARCRELAPVFTDAEVGKLAEGLVMIRQNADDRSPFVDQTLGEHGTYVPRLFFLTPDGKVRGELTSGHPRYPFFYSPATVEALKANMRKAAQG